MKRQKIVQGSSAKMLQVLQPQAVREEEAVRMAALADERDKQIEDIEKGMTEINDLMVNIASLVNQQAQTVDSIADHIDKAVVNTDKGVKELEQAAEYQRSWACSIS